MVLLSNLFTIQRFDNELLCTKKIYISTKIYALFFKMIFHIFQHLPCFLYLYTRKSINHSSLKRGNYLTKLYYITNFIIFRAHKETQSTSLVKNNVSIQCYKLATNAYKTFKLHSCCAGWYTMFNRLTSSSGICDILGWSFTHNFDYIQGTVSQVPDRYSSIYSFPFNLELTVNIENSIHQSTWNSPSNNKMDYST